MKLPLVAFALVIASAVVVAQGAAQAPPIDRLRAAVERVTKSVNATWGIYVKSLDTGEELAIDADRQMETMSTIKIPLMVEALQQIKDGKFALTDKYTLRAGRHPARHRDHPAARSRRRDDRERSPHDDDHRLGQHGDRRALPDGRRPGCRQRAHEDARPEETRAMTCRQGLVSRRSRPRRSSEAFYRRRKTPFGLSTPREMGRLLEMMERGTLVDKPSSDLMLQIMRGQLYRTRIPRYVTGYRIPHKTGDFLPYVGDDVGVLEAPGRTIVLTIFTGNHFGSGETLENAIGLVAKEVGDYFAYRR